MKLKISISILILFLFQQYSLFAQSRPYEGPDDPAADIAAERAGFLTGNRVLLFFRNTTELGDCCGLGYFTSKWPNNYEGSDMHDGITILIGARVFVENDSIPVTDINEIRSRTDLDTIFYCQSSFREFMDKDPTETIEWALYPVFGYFNELSETPAMSNLPESWPLNGWPAKGNALKWPGEWNGRFGRGVMKADQECYFVANDAQDQEYLGPEDTLRYYPRPGKYIGDIKPDVTIQKGLPWGGIGIRIETRGFQWSNPSAADAVFFEYTIANISDYDLPEMYFGLQVDNSIGGEEGGSGDDIAFYDKRLDMCYSWDYDGIPVGGGKEPGIMGLAYLESPGRPYDTVDNDEDGLVDEKRDNKAIEKIGPYDGIENLDNFLAFYNLEEEDLQEHWDADEDQDWRDGIDENNNDKYDEGEDPGDDLGLDGVGPYDLNYTGPDADGTECNHKPDLEEGIGAEPNFGLTDVSESDMLGLTSFRYLLEWIAGTGGLNTAAGDESIFYWLTSGVFDEAQMIPKNFIEQFASGIFPLHKGHTERISMAELHSYDPLAGLNSDEHKAQALFRLKEVVQNIYETDYRFAQPPLMPTLHATAGDGKVVLTWDSKSDQLTRDSFVRNENDFEGYKLYRATDKYMADPMVITDIYGTPTLRQSIYQCDVIDGKKGITNFGLVNGIAYYLGDDTGLSHSFVDNTVQNGRTYYYVLVAYDYGIPEVGEGIPPSENTFVLEIDEQENVQRVSANVAIAIPHQIAAGYSIPGIDIHTDISTNKAESYQIMPEILDYQLLKKGHTYKVKLNMNYFDHSQSLPKFRSPYDLLWTNDGFLVYDVTLGDSLIYQENTNSYIGKNVIEGKLRASDWMYYTYLDTNKEVITDPFDGIRLHMKPPLVFATFDSLNSGWLVGDASVNFHLSGTTDPKANPTSQKWRYYPWEYEIVWTENASYTTRINRTSMLQDHEGNNLVKADVLIEESYNFYVVNKSFKDSTGAYPLMDLVIYDVDHNGMFNADSDYVLVGDAVDIPNSSRILWGGTIFSIDFRNITNPDQMPKPNDVYRIDFNRPFLYDDSLMFTVTGIDGLDEQQLEEDMNNIKVVPNPYVATNTMETAVANWQRNQRRQLMFTNIPAQCTIKIFTVSGVLVDEIDVNNSSNNRETFWDTNTDANGTVHWDLLTKEGLEIAAGYYIYHVKSKVTGHEKVGKFAVIK